MVKCKYCDKETDNNKFCSYKCKGLWCNPKTSKKWKRCLTCNEPTKNKKYCSRFCFSNNIRKKESSPCLACANETYNLFCSRDCSNKRKKYARQKIKRVIVKFAGGCCSQCGYNKCMGALHFHHTGAKENEISAIINNVVNEKNDWLTLLSELNKTIVLCANCHSEYHYKN